MKGGTPYLIQYYLKTGQVWTRLPHDLLICHSCVMLKKKEMLKAVHQVCQMTTLKKENTKESVKLKGKLGNSFSSTI